ERLQAAGRRERLDRLDAAPRRARVDLEDPIGLEQRDEVTRLRPAALVERPLAVRPLPLVAMAGPGVPHEQERHQPNALSPASSAAGYAARIARLRSRSAAIRRPAAIAVRARARRRRRVSTTTASWCSPITSCTFFRAATARAGDLRPPSAASSAAYRAR